MIFGPVLLPQMKIVHRKKLFGRELSRDLGTCNVTCSLAADFVPLWPKTANDKIQAVHNFIFIETFEPECDYDAHLKAANIRMA